MSDPAFACERCGTGLPAGAKFCGMCGATVVRRAAAPPPPPVSVAEAMAVAAGQAVPPPTGQPSVVEQLPPPTVVMMGPAGAGPGSPTVVPGPAPVAPSPPAVVPAAPAFPAAPSLPRSPARWGGTPGANAPGGLVAATVGKRVAATVVDGVVGAVLGTAAALVAFAVFPAEGGGMPEQDAWSSPAASGDWFESVSGSLPAWEPGQLAVLGAFGLLALAVFWPLSAFKGVTPGKAALGLRLAEFRTAQAPGLWPVFGRYLRIAGPGLVSELAVLAMTVAGANRTAVLALMAVAGLAGLGAIVAFVAMVVTIFQDRSTPRTWYDKGSGLWLTDIRASGIAGLISSGRAVAPADLGPPVQPSVPVQPAAPMQPNEPMAASSAGPVAPVPSATPAVRSGPALPASSSRPTGTVPGQSGLITAVPGITPAIRPDLTGPAGPGTPGDVFAAPPSPPPASHHSPGAPGLRPPPAAGSPAASGQAASAGPVPGRPRPPEQSEPPGPIGAPLDTSGFFAPAPVEPAPGPLGQPGAPMPPLDLGGDDEAGITRRSLTPGMPAATFVLSFDTGESVVVRGTGLVGRRPQPRRGEAVAVHLVPIQDAAMSVSKTHLAFGLAGGDLWVSDRQSTNGTVVVRRDGLEQVAAPGKAVIVRVGDRVRFGERSFQVREG